MKDLIDKGFAMMQKQYLYIFIAVVLVFVLGLSSSSIAATSDITININDEQLETDVAPVIIDERTMVPMRAIFEELSADVHWDGDKEKITGTRGGDVIELHLNTRHALINGESEYLDVPPTIVSERTMVPTRFIAESLGAEVKWDGEARVVNIHTDAKALESPREKLSVAEVIELIEPATVKIETSRSHGSGFFITQDGQVATNAHVVRGSKWIEVITSNAKRYPAELHKIDNAADLAILKIDAETTFPYLDDFLYEDDISRGEEVLAFGNPLDYEQTVTKGIISGIRERDAEAWIYTRTEIQHDAEIAPGSSGGPLVNLYGELVGINYREDPLGYDFSFSLPANNLYFLMLQEHTYNLEDDFNSYWTEHWRWEKLLNEVVLEVVDEAFTAMDMGYYSRAADLLEEALYLKNQVYQEVSGYNPLYSEIETLRQLNLTRLDALSDFYGYILIIVDDPYYYSESELRQLSNNLEEAEERYYSRLEHFLDRF